MIKSFWTYDLQIIDSNRAEAQENVMRAMWLAMGCVAVIASSLEAQAKPFTKRPVSQVEFAAAIAANDQTILNVGCLKMVEAANEVRGDLRLADCAALAEYVRGLPVAPCPRVTSGLARVLESGAIDLRGWRRELQDGEMCLYDGNEAVWFASLSCGNFITERLSVAGAMRQPSPILGVAVTRADTLVLTGSLELNHRFADDTLNIRIIGLEQPVIEQRPGWLRRNLEWWVPPVAVAGGILGYFCVTDWCVGDVRQETNVNVRRGAVVFSIPIP